MAAQRGPELSSPFRCPRRPGEPSLLSSIPSHSRDQEPQLQVRPAARWACSIAHVAAAPAGHQSLLAEAFGALRAGQVLSLGDKAQSLLRGWERGVTFIRNICKAHLTWWWEVPRTLGSDHVPMSEVDHWDFVLCSCGFLSEGCAGWAPAHAREFCAVLASAHSHMH